MSCAELLRYQSVSDRRTKSSSGAPYGPEVRDIFDHMLAKAGRDRLPTRDYATPRHESFIHRRTWRPTIVVAFVDHLDVVPADDAVGRTMPSNRLCVCVIGRGSLDNKASR